MFGSESLFLLDLRSKLRSVEGPLTLSTVVVTLVNSFLGLGAALYGTSCSTNVFRFISTWLHSLINTIEGLTRNHSPFGFKMNAHLDSLFSVMSLSLLKITSVVLDSLISLPLTKAVFVGISVTIGISGCLALAFDVILLMSTGIKLLSNFFTQIIILQANVLKTLFRVFRGYKYNVLRERVDRERFSSAQVILCSFMFIISMFLFQTTVAYFLLSFALWTPIKYFLRLIKMIFNYILSFPMNSLVEADISLNSRDFYYDIVPTNGAFDSDEQIYEDHTGRLFKLRKQTRPGHYYLEIISEWLLKGYKLTIGTEPGPL